MNRGLFFWGNPVSAWPLNELFPAESQPLSIKNPFLPIPMCGVLKTVDFKGRILYSLIGSGQVLVGLLDFKSSGGQTMSVVGSIPMHFRHLV
jgi:hypothetical protein